MVINMSEYTIKQIFIDNWDRFLLENPNLNIRPVVFEEVIGFSNISNYYLSTFIFS